MVLLVRVWQPVEVLTADRVERGGCGAPASAAPGSHGLGDPRRAAVVAAPAPRRAAAAGGDATALADDRSEVLRAYAPYLVIIAIFSITNIPAVVDYLARTPWTVPLRLARPGHRQQCR